jgi:hypothetical protein
MARRDRTAYADMAAARPQRTFAGHDVSRPVEGHFRFKLVSGSVYGGVRIWYGAPHDPVTGEELDRSWRWQATFDGEPVDLDRVWPACLDDPISEEEHANYLRRRQWARQHAPDSAYAERGRKIDLLSIDNPLPF